MPVHASDDILPNADVVCACVSQLYPVLFRPLTENECIKRLLPERHGEAHRWSFERTPTNEWLDAGIAGYENHSKEI
jgi:hypothetical protein